MDLISSIRRDYGLDIIVDDAQASSAIQHLTRNLEHACTSLSEELYSKATHFILELVQNADDNTYPDDVTPTLIMKLEGPQFTTWCNEVGFNAQNVRAICSIGKSTKSNTSGYIGEKGIGFKSVFTVADTVRVLSGPYTFMFDKREKLGMIAPIWTSDRSSYENWTSFELHLSAKTRREELVARIQDIQPSLLLFLRKVHCIELVGDHSHIRLEKDLVGGVTRIMRCSNVTDHAVRDYILFQHTVSRLPADEKRLGVQQSDIVLAFPITEAGDPTETEEEVHAFLPLRSYGFCFIIQGDFLTASNREDILTDKEWNRVLRNTIAPAFMQAIPELQNRPALTYTWIRYLQSNITDAFFKPAHISILSTLRHTPVLLGRDGLPYRPHEILILPPQYKNALDSEPLVPEAYLNSRHYLASQYDADKDREILLAMGVKDMSSSDFLNGIQAMQKDGSLFAQESTWWEGVCTVLRELRRRNEHDARHCLLLSIVPLADGNWVPATCFGILFDSAIADIPQDLNLKLIKALDPRSSHYKLLEELGVKEADYAKVAEAIMVFHWRSPKLLNSKTLPSHARFLFRHQRDAYQANLAHLRVATANNHVIFASEAYMDHHNHAFPPLSSCLTGDTAYFLHSDYGELPWTNTMGERMAWRDWLHTQLGVNISPKIGPITLSPEFRAFVRSASTADLLAFLVEYSDDMRDQLRRHPDAFNELRTAYVDTLSCGRQPLHTTYIARGGLRSFANLPLLPVQDPESRRWDYLGEYGVSFQVDGDFYLKELIRLSEKPLKPMSGFFDETLGLVKLYYKQLEARFNDADMAEKIRHAFVKHSLVYIPARDCGVSGHGRWTSWRMADVVWDGPRCMRSKYALSKVYSEAQTFFCELLKIPPCPESILLQEIQFIWSKDKDTILDEAAHVHIHEILVDLDATFTAAQDWTHAWAPSWIQQLQWLPFVPTEVAPGVIKLKSIQDGVYLPDLTGELTKLFIGHVPIVSKPPEMSGGSVRSLHHLFTFPWIGGVKSLETSVRRSLGLGTTTGSLVTDPILSNWYCSRTPYLIRLADTILDPELASSLQTLVVQMQNIQIYQTPSESVQHIFTLDNVSLTALLSLGVETTSDSCNVFIGTTCRREQRDILICMELARLCPAIRATDLFTILTQPPFVLDTLFPPATPAKSEELPTGPFFSQPPADNGSEAVLKDAVTAEVVTTVEPIAVESITAQSITAESINTRVCTTETKNADDGQLEGLVENMWRLTTREPDSTPNLSHSADSALLPVETIYAATRQDEESRYISDIPVRAAYHPSMLDNQLRSRSSQFVPNNEQLGPKPGLRSTIQKTHQPEIQIDTVISMTVPTLQKPATEASLRLQSPMSPPSDEQEFAGVMGEICFFKFCERTLPDFSLDNWTSELRVHLNFPAYQGISVADFTYRDSQGVLTEKLFGTARKDRYRDRWPTYYLEVKATSGMASEPFHTSALQLSTACKMAIGNKQVPKQVYVLVRISSVRSKPSVQMYPDPWRLLSEGRLRHVSDVDMVIS